METKINFNKNIAIIYFIIMFLLVSGCSTNESVLGPILNIDTTSVALNSVVGNIILPPNTSIKMSDLTAVSIGATSSVTAQGSVANEGKFNAGLAQLAQPELVIVKDRSGNLISLGSFFPGEKVLINDTSAALAWCMLDPNFLFFSPEAKKIICQKIKQHNKFGQLVQKVNQNLISKPTDPFDTQDQTLQSLAVQIIKDIINPPTIAPSLSKGSNENRTLKLRDRSAPGAIDDGKGSGCGSKKILLLNRSANWYFCYPTLIDDAGKVTMLDVVWLKRQSASYGLAWSWNPADFLDFFNTVEKEMDTKGDGKYQLHFVKNNLFTATDILFNIVGLVAGGGQMAYADIDDVAKKLENANLVATILKIFNDVYKTQDYKQMIKDILMLVRNPGAYAVMQYAVQKYLNPSNAAFQAQFKDLAEAYAKKVTGVLAIVDAVFTVADLSAIVYDMYDDKTILPIADSTYYHYGNLVIKEDGTLADVNIECVNDYNTSEWIQKFTIDPPIDACRTDIIYDDNFSGKINLKKIPAAQYKLKIVMHNQSLQPPAKDTIIDLKKNDNLNLKFVFGMLDYRIVLNRYDTLLANDIELTLPLKVKWGETYHIEGKWGQDVYKFPDATYSIMAGFINDISDMWLTGKFDSNPKVIDTRGSHHFFKIDFTMPAKIPGKTIFKFQVSMQALNNNDASAPSWLQGRIYKIPIVDY